MFDNQTPLSPADLTTLFELFPLALWFLLAVFGQLICWLTKG